VVTDVSLAPDVERMVGHAIEKFGRIDYAVNNAGFEDSAPASPMYQRKSGNEF
jgi:NAD(P)-dependent dehydrogenase (short-subunit alcohol dehydrogenase family)